MATAKRAQRRAAPGKTPRKAAKPARKKPVRVYEIVSDDESINREEGHLTPMDKMNMSKEGVTKKDFEAIKERLRLDYDSMATILSVTRATLLSKKGDEKFNTPLSERIIDVNDIYSYGIEVFEDEDRLQEWIHRPNKALGGKTPIDIMDSQFGREEVRNLIGRIAYGVYS
jgi:putative toxin-antitoxin system antitoxin component (TIGR02293 family)